MPRPSLSYGNTYAEAFQMEKPEDLQNENAVIKSLVPNSRGIYHDQMLMGEEAFKKEDYKRAASCFKLAREISMGSPESLLSLMHAHFATARGTSYTITAYYLQEALKNFPELPLANIRLRYFYGRTSNFIRDLNNLEDVYLTENPNDASAMFVLAYLKWQEGDPEGAQIWLSKALRFSYTRHQKEAIHTLWDGMVATGKVTGELKPAKLPGDKDKTEQPQN